MEQTDLAFPLPQPGQVMSPGCKPKEQNEESNLMCLSLRLNEIKILKNTGWGYNKLKEWCSPPKLHTYPKGRAGKHFQKEAAAR